MSKRIDRESPIHRSVLAYLRVKLPGAVIAHVPNEMNLKGDPRSKAIAQGKAKSLGMLPGFPDLLCIWRGRFMGFEVKAKGNYPSEAQKSVGQAMIDQGAEWGVVRSIEDVDACLSEWGIGAATEPGDAR